MRLARFPLGQITATPGAVAALERSGDNLGILLKRHVTGDWGDIDDHDREENERSVVYGFRLLSAYTLTTGVRIWIIREADRSGTTLLLPSEY